MPINIALLSYLHDTKTLGFSKPTTSMHSTQLRNHMGRLTIDKNIFQSL